MLFIDFVATYAPPFRGGMTCAETLDCRVRGESWFAYFWSLYTNNSSPNLHEQSRVILFLYHRVRFPLISLWISALKVKPDKAA